MLNNFLKVLRALFFSPYLREGGSILVTEKNVFQTEALASDNIAPGSRQLGFLILRAG